MVAEVQQLMGYSNVRMTSIRLYVNRKPARECPGQRIAAGSDSWNHCPGEGISRVEAGGSYGVGTRGGR